jgi:hypothetical protein
MFIGSQREQWFDFQSPVGCGSLPLNKGALEKPQSAGFLFTWPDKKKQGELGL